MKRNGPYYSRGQQLTKLALHANNRENVNKTKKNPQVLTFLPEEHTTPYAIGSEENELDKDNSLLPDLSLTDMTIGSSIGSTSLTCLDSGFIIPVDNVKHNEDCGMGIGSYTSIEGTLKLSVSEDTMTYPTPETFTQDTLVLSNAEIFIQHTPALPTAEPSIQDNLTFTTAEITINDNLILPTAEMSLQDTLMLPNVCTRTQDTLALPTAEISIEDTLTLPNAGKSAQDTLALPTAEISIEDTLTLPNAGKSAQDTLALPTAETFIRDTLTLATAEMSIEDTLTLPNAGTSTQDTQALPTAEISIEDTLTLPNAGKSAQDTLALPTAETFIRDTLTLATRQNQVLAVLWHEAISGRNKEDLVSTYYAFLKSHREDKKIILWVDNCTSQNKNWALFSFFLYIINSNEIDALEITLKYFEPGHSFMSADSFHHRVELSMKRAGGKIYDFQDFSQAVLQSSKNVEVKKLNYEDFYQWIDYTSQYKLQKLNPRPYLHDMVEVTFRKGSHDIFYKKSYNGEVFAVNVLMAKFSKTGVLTGPKQNNKPCGISKDKKKNLIKVIKPIMIKNRLKFWNDLPVSE